ncbi:hypothetical protein JHK82_012658 [Glycine max]|uniref:Uncharacterized protein n=1 Tax=Glycine soja TaxID=3848 RepID=A0A0B2SEP3_GLYSO|nr:hypothetical protein JHK85_013013 [Glycine max]KAG5057684.1 hypothetical protein JHK86_012680 [Glycine max]KAG5154689.1 hypothetical protein JHK82_012658 [Glycine max]KHN42762.1 hypothetical protein glysoja_030245 [Glycine soja]
MQEFNIGFQKSTLKGMSLPISFSFDGTLSLNLPKCSFSFKSLFLSCLQTSQISLLLSPPNFYRSSLSRCKIGI